MRGLFNWLIGDPAHRTQSFLRSQEGRLIAWIVPRVPAEIEPIQLSLLGVAAAVLAAFALVASDNWPRAMWLVPLAMVVNWLGLSVDLPLARHRGSEAAAEGMAHHLSEIFSHLSIMLAYGFSPFFTLKSATIAIVCYLLFSAYAYIRAATRHVEQMAYIGIGVTEFRILLALWPFAAEAMGVPRTLDETLPPVDLATIFLATLTVAGLLTKRFLDSRKIEAASGQEE